MKKCIVCLTPAVYKIKDTSDYYCPSCAEENFSDLDLLLKMEDEAVKLQAYIQENE